jgi:hypothetical protein
MLCHLERSLLSKILSTQFTPITFIADSGASCNFCGSLEGKGRMSLKLWLSTMRPCPVTLMIST